VVEGPGANASTGAQGCGSSTPTPAATPDFLIRAHRRPDGYGTRRSHQIDRRPPFVRMEPAVSARALTISQGRAITRCTALPFLCSTSLTWCCDVAVRRRRRSPSRCFLTPPMDGEPASCVPGRCSARVLPCAVRPPNRWSSHLCARWWDASSACLADLVYQHQEP